MPSLGVSHGVLNAIKVPHIVSVQVWLCVTCRNVTGAVCVCLPLKLLESRNHETWYEYSGTGRRPGACLQ
jgi:hypothetical protein